jgi:hypothetical protein
MNVNIGTPTNPHWARVVGYGPFTLCIIRKEGLCPSSGDINMLMTNNSVCIKEKLRAFCDTRLISLCVYRNIKKPMQTKVVYFARVQI